jgi:hypothetical protein
MSTPGQQLPWNFGGAYGPTGPVSGYNPWDVVGASPSQWGNAVQNWRRTAGGTTGGLTTDAQNWFGSGLPMSGFGGGSGGGMGGGGSGSRWGGGMSIEQLLAKQEAENARARQFNIDQWTAGNQNLQGVLGRADADPMTMGARDLASQLLANPEAINDSVQQQILNRARAQMEAQAQAAQQQAIGTMMSGGQMSDSALGALNERMARQRMASLSGLTSQVEIERALRRRQDELQAATLARQLGMDRSGLDFGVAQTWMTNLMHDAPEDYTGWAALANAGSGFGGGGGLNFKIGQTRGGAPTTGWSWDTRGEQAFSPYGFGVA